jgi:hypothetical protein
MADIDVVEKPTTGTPTWVWALVAVLAVGGQEQLVRRGRMVQAQEDEVHQVAPGQETAAIPDPTEGERHPPVDPPHHGPEVPLHAGSVHQGRANHGDGHPGGLGLASGEQSPLLLGEIGESGRSRRTGHDCIL